MPTDIVANNLGLGALFVLLLTFIILLYMCVNMIRYEFRDLIYNYHDLKNHIEKYGRKYNGILDNVKVIIMFSFLIITLSGYIFIILLFIIDKYPKT